MSKMDLLVMDNGLFVSMAERMARDERVGYFSSYANAFPVSREFAPGTGIKGVVRVNEPIAFLAEIQPDLVVIPDLYHNDFERLCRSLPVPTFGAANGNRLETDRWFLKEFLQKHHQPVVDSVEILGIDALREFLQQNEDKYVKVSVYRGDHETEHHETWEKSEHLWFNKLAARLGPIGNQIRFVVEDPIPDAIEVGIDTFFMGGKLITPLLLGIEQKDAGYFGVVLDELPEMLEPLFKALSGYFEEQNYRCWFSNEMRIRADGTIYMTDATCRMPSPPGGVMLEAIENFTEFVSNLANGLPSAVPDFGDNRYCAEFVFKSPQVQDGWLEVDAPAAGFKPHNYCRMDGKLWIIPHDSGFIEFGSAIGMGEDADSAKKMAEKNAEKVKASGAYYDKQAVNEAQEQLQKVMELLGVDLPEG